MSSPPSSPPAPGGEASPTISSNDKNVPSGINEQGQPGRTKQGDRRLRAPAASLVVCGVDGTVYTLDAYTGQLRHMFASGPALVSSSSSSYDAHFDKYSGMDNGPSDDSVNGKDGGKNSDYCNEPTNELLTSSQTTKPTDSLADSVSLRSSPSDCARTDDETPTLDFDMADKTMGNQIGEQATGDAIGNAVVSNASPRLKETVVPGLDGQLYSLLEPLSGMPSTDVDEDGDTNPCEAGDNNEGNDYLEGFCESSIAHDEGGSSSKSGIPRFGPYKLSPLPISAMDVVDSPISTCRPVTDGDGQQCGIIVGSKKTTIYAIDPVTGKVLWTQDPMGGGGGRGYTKHPPRNGASRGRAVLLQREDYAVHSSLEGVEVWRVEVGIFSALDFDIEATSGRSAGSVRQEPVGDHDAVFGDETAAEAGRGDHMVGGRQRGAAAVASSEKRKSGVPPIIGGRKKTSLHDFDSGFGVDRHPSSSGRKENILERNGDATFDADCHSPSRGLPSIAFTGDDGTSVMAVDGISGELLWKRRIDSVVAAVYGVGKDSSWIALNEIAESEVWTQGYSSAHNGQRGGHLRPSSFLTSLRFSEGLVPYGGGETELGKHNRLGQHHSNFFVKSFDVIGGYNSHALDGYKSYDTSSLLLQDGGLRNDFQKAAEEISAIPSEVDMTDSKPLPSHRTEHGLYLTWSMVTFILMLVPFLLFFSARIIILRQKRKWGNTHSLDPTTATLSGEDGREPSQSSNEIIMHPSLNKPAPSSGKLWLNNHHHPVVTRSVSLDALGSNSLAFINAAPSFLPIKNGATTVLPDSQSTAVSLRNMCSERGTAFSTSTTDTASPPAILRCKTLPTEASHPDDISSQPKFHLGVDNIDGIPLVRYSRYRSEFEEKSALGRGGFGTVFQCRNNLDSSEYAIKKINITSQLGVDGRATKQFSQKLHRVLREVKILALLDHPNIVRYYTAWLEIDDDTPNEKDETYAMDSIFDKKSQGIFSSSIFSGVGSNSQITETPLKSKNNIYQGSPKGLLRSYNPLGWNDFGSFQLDESESEVSSSTGTRVFNAPIVAENAEEEDLGFNWERSEENTMEPQAHAVRPLPRKVKEETSKDRGSQSTSAICSVDSQESQSKRPNITQKAVEDNSMDGRHILFIQMQLCSSQTLADFLADRKVRSTPTSLSMSQNSSYAVDIPYALRLFVQISNGVKYVHKQGLIHRDLKPQNIFIDDAGNVKVGDFGLSRESSSASNIADFEDCEKGGTQYDQNFLQLDDRDAEITAGVGTRAYASPEQMRGSNYDASTDIYSLGMILFELCYPMYTAMERCEEFGSIRKGNFPLYWKSNVKTTFPTMHDLLVRMISESSTERPSADVVSDRIDSLLQEYSVQSLDKSWGKKGALLLRVEAEEKEGVLAIVMKLIKDAAPRTRILQYGLRGQASRAIMEFAIDAESESPASVESISSCLHKHAMTVRQITNS